LCQTARGIQDVGLKPLGSSIGGKICSVQLYAFCYTMPAEAGYARTDFVATGSGEANGASGPYADRIVRRGDTSPDGLREKARFVLGAMERRMGVLGRSWSEVTATQLYTVFDIYPALAEEFVRRGATAAGLTWHYARPPVLGLDVEVDVRGLSREIVL